MKRSEIIRAATIEIERALAAHADLLETQSRRTLTVRLAVTRIEGGVRVAGTCLANNRKHFSFGTLIANKKEDLQ